MKALKEEVNDRSAVDISREIGINKQTFYYWKKKYAGMNGYQLSGQKMFEEENG